MDAHTYKVLEIEKIKDILRGCVLSDLGGSLIEKSYPIFDQRIIETKLSETRELAELLGCNPDFTLWGAVDIRPILRRVRAEGSALTPDELLSIKVFVNGTGRVKGFFRGKKRDSPLVSAWVEKLIPMPELARQLNKVINDKGEILDTASPSLRSIRASIKGLGEKIKGMLEEKIRFNPQALQERLLTVRNDRYVLPLKPDFKKHMRGNVLDRSSSGATLYVEPEEVIPLNNELAQLRSAEEEEILRVLREMTGVIRVRRSELKINSQVMAELDYMYAKARFSIDYGCSVPIVHNESSTLLKRARHPLLLKQHREGGVPTQVVPLNISIGDDFNTLLVTGPNTGGKTVAIKTLGLLNIMTQMGIPIPARDDSRVGIFHKIFADIGDEQSIEQSLSTFSSHITHIKGILEGADSRSLVLLDELGAGTDPVEGASLGIAILDHLARAGAKTVATTHHSALKLYVFSQRGMRNSSMEFDADSLEPTYRLRMGISGSSRALDVAKRLGVPEAVLSRAKQEIDTGSFQAKELLEKLEAELERVAKERELMEAEKRELARKKEEEEKLLSGLKEEKGKVKETLRKEVSTFIKQGRRELEETIASLRKEARESGKVGFPTLTFKEMTKKGEEILSLEEAESKDKALFNVGDAVYVKSLRSEGSVIGRSKATGRLIVEMGQKRLEVKAGDLKLMPSPGEIAHPSAVAGVKVTLEEEASSPLNELNVIGCKVDEAIPRVDKYLDDAFSRGISTVKIIHGYGTGRLRRAIAGHLKGHPQVKAYHHGKYHEGGRGVTLVTINV